MDRTKRWFKKGLNLAFLAFLALPGISRAEMLVKSSDTSWVSFDAATRDEFDFVQGAAANGGWSQAIKLDSIRGEFAGQVDKDIKFTFNSEYNGGTNNMQVLDAIVQFEFSDEFNVWAGRFLAPTDRSNLSGNYFLNSWKITGVMDPYYSKVGGRDDGVAIWGQEGGGAFKWQVGAFDGNQAFNPSSSLLYAARLTFNFLDPDPGYYNSSTYLGKDILALGVVGQYQPYGASSATKLGDFAGGNVDLLFEKKMDAGVLDLEGAYYALNTDGVTDGIYTDGTGYFVLASYLFDQIEPNVRWMAAMPTGGNETDYVDAGVAYYLTGYSKLAFNYENVSVAGTSTSEIELGTQLLY
jgi:hypothetical protein